MPALSDEQQKQLFTYAKDVNYILWHGAQKPDGSGRTDIRQHFYNIEGMLTEIKANQMTMLGKDWVNEQEIIDGVLNGLGSKDLDDVVTALKAAFGDRAAELATKLAAATTTPAS